MLPECRVSIVLAFRGKGFLKRSVERSKGMRIVKRNNLRILNYSPRNCAEFRPDSREVREAESKGAFDLPSAMPPAKLLAQSESI